MITDGLTPLAFLAFAGAVLLTGAGIVAVLVAFYLGRRDFARRVTIAAALCWASYGVVLVATSLVTRERVLTVGQEKHICELDCHLAYAVQDLRTAQVLGAGALAARGAFYVVRVRARFDSGTIATWRPRDVPVRPGPREIALVDDAGHRYPADAAAGRGLAAGSGEAEPLSRSLLPGESYVTTLVFDIPKDARGLRLDLGARAGPPDLFIIGYEHSLWHKKTLFALPAPEG
ncbi:MAG TPA: hypothetical protein VFK78_08940 [Gemmatimonadales bacterium]|nr:hypothetical protein [Gemmatimonadales bacterium]